MKQEVYIALEIKGTKLTGKNYSEQLHHENSH
jgi:hypothetical protein